MRYPEVYYVFPESSNLLTPQVRHSTAGLVLIDLIISTVSTETWAENGGGEAEIR